MCPVLIKHHSLQHYHHLGSNLQFVDVTAQTNCELEAQTGKHAVTKYKVKCIYLSFNENDLSKYILSHFCDRPGVYAACQCSSVGMQCA